MKKSLNPEQVRTLQAVEANRGANVHTLAKVLGHKQTYETTLKERLLRMVHYGWLTQKVITNRDGRSVRERRFHMTWKGIAYLEDLKLKETDLKLKETAK